MTRNRCLVQTPAPRRRTPAELARSHCRTAAPRSRHQTSGTKRPCVGGSGGGGGGGGDELGETDREEVGRGPQLFPCLQGSRQQAQYLKLKLNVISYGILSYLVLIPLKLSAESGAQ